MAYDEQLEQRVRHFFVRKRVKAEAMRMMGGLCFMVNRKMCVSVEVLKRKGCRPMDFTGGP